MSRRITPPIAAFVVLAIAAMLISRQGSNSRDTALRTSEHRLLRSDFEIDPRDPAYVVSSIVEAQYGFESLGARWRGGSSIVLNHRVSTDGECWSEWSTLPEDRHGRDLAMAHVGRLQFYPEPVRFLQFRAEIAPEEIDVVFIRPGKLSSTAGGAPVRAASAENPVPKPDVVSRTDWGCPDGQGSRWPPIATDVDFLIVHHSAGSNTSNNWIATVQSIWSFHTLTRGWGDVGYNFLIDPNGVIYEGRAGGDSVGAHFSCTNGGTMGVCLIGNFTGQEPTTAALDSLAHLLAWKSEVKSIDPLTQAYHSQSDLTLDRISGHRDGNAGTEGCASGTVCPGAMLYPLLPDVRTRVANIIATGVPDPPAIGLGNYLVDGELSPGNTINFSASIVHLDGSPATGIHATLSSSSPYLTVTDPTKNYPDLSTGGSANQIGDFDFALAPDAPHGHQATLSLAVTADHGEWIFPIVLSGVISPPVIELVDLSASPNQADAGTSITIAYEIVADRAFMATFELALIDRSGVQRELASFSSGVGAGIQIKNRGILIPAEVPPEIYALRVRINEGDTALSENIFPAILTVLSQTFSDWAASRIFEAGQRSAVSDPDGDGLSNLIEYAFMLDPALPEPSPVEFLWVQEGAVRYPALRFPERVGTALSINLQRFANGSWIESGIEVAAEPLVGVRRRTIRSARSEASSERQLLRLQVSVE